MITSLLLEFIKQLPLTDNQIQNLQSIQSLPDADIIQAIEKEKALSKLFNEFAIEEESKELLNNYLTDKDIYWLKRVADLNDIEFDFAQYSQNNKAIDKQIAQFLQQAIPDIKEPIQESSSSSSAPYASLPSVFFAPENKPFEVPEEEEEEDNLQELEDLLLQIEQQLIEKIVVKEASPQYLPHCTYSDILQQSLNLLENNHQLFTERLSNLYQKLMLTLKDTIARVQSSNLIFQDMQKPLSSIETNLRTLLASSDSSQAVYRVIENIRNYFIEHLKTQDPNVNNFEKLANQFKFDLAHYASTGINNHHTNSAKNAIIEIDRISNDFSLYSVNKFKHLGFLLIEETERAFEKTNNKKTYFKTLLRTQINLLQACKVYASSEIPVLRLRKIYGEFIYDLHAYKARNSGEGVKSVIRNFLFRKQETKRIITKECLALADSAINALRENSSDISTSNDINSKIYHLYKLLEQLDNKEEGHKLSSALDRFLQKVFKPAELQELEQQFLSAEALPESLRAFAP